MGAGATLVERKPGFAAYTGTKLDVEVMPRVKAAAALDGKSVQEWLSDLANEHASRRIKEPPIKRKPQPPHPKRNPK